MTFKVEQIKFCSKSSFAALSLCNNELPDEEREVIAKAIYNFPVPESLEAFKHSPRSNGILLDLLDFTSDTPSLKPLVGENSWFIFKILGIDLVLPKDFG